MLVVIGQELGSLNAQNSAQLAGANTSDNTRGLATVLIVAPQES